MQVDDLQLYLKCHSSTGVFKHFASENQLPGLSNGTLDENGLIPSYINKSVKFLSDKFDD